MSSSSAYARRCIINGARDHWRRIGRHEAAVDPQTYDYSTRLNDYSVRREDHAVEIGDADFAWRLCSTLPPRQRAALVLRYYEGLPDEEIAEIMRCRAGTVRSQISRALSALRVTHTLASKEVEK